MATSVKGTLRITNDEGRIIDVSLNESFSSVSESPFERARFRRRIHKLLKQAMK